MKTFFPLFSTVIVFLSIGCASPNPYGRVTNHATTNLTGTVIVQKVGNQPPVTYAQTNFTVSSTSKPVVPPMPSAGINGVTPLAVDAPMATAPEKEREPQERVAPRQGSSGQNVTPNSYGAPTLRPSRSGSDTPLRSNRTLSMLGDGLGGFFFPTIYRGSGASLNATAYASGRVNVPVSRFERMALEHDAQVHGGQNSRLIGGVRVNSHNATLAVGGAGAYRSGLGY